METLPVPVAGPGEIVVKVLAVGICASDAKCFYGAPLFWGDKDRKAYCQPPITPGHEFVGEVVSLGEGTAEKYGLQVGDHAVSEQIVPCWDCRFCVRGKYNMCAPHEIYGFRQATPGAMATYMKWPKGSLNHKVPKSVPVQHAAFIEPLACGIHAVNQGNIQFNDVVVIAGCGPLGLGMIAAARLKNPAKLIALDLMDWKLDIARKCGADVLINPKNCDVIEEVKKLTQGYGCDVYIEVTGHPNSVRQGLNMIAKQGRFVEYSVFGQETSVDWTIIGDTKELTIQGGHLGPYCYPKAIEMLDKKQIPMDSIVTHVLDLADYLNGFKMVHDSDKSIKVVLKP
jgi:threonine dehydrogenase-like Zn-dependent dehydrogenase